MRHQTAQKPAVLNTVVPVHFARAAVGRKATVRQVIKAFLDTHGSLREPIKIAYARSLEHHFPQLLELQFRQLTPDIIRDAYGQGSIGIDVDDERTSSNGGWGLYTATKRLRRIVCWQCLQRGLPSPWPNLQLYQPRHRSLPPELQTATGRRRLVSELRAQDTPGARACLFLCFTGLWLREALGCTANDWVGPQALKFRKRWLHLHLTLATQATALIHPLSMPALLNAGELQVRRALIEIFGERTTSSGRKNGVVTPSDLKRLFRWVACELGINAPALRGFGCRAVPAFQYGYELQPSALAKAAQRIADELEQPSLPSTVVKLAEFKRREA